MGAVKATLLLDLLRRKFGFYSNSLELHCARSAMSVAPVQSAAGGGSFCIGEVPRQNSCSLYRESPHNTYE